ncbi:hypothetical protein [Phenylobacterium sp.]|uniref:hypothetical protein n=1 Tax=Phenylobacterium sp. TaxID=1871053 RepID=UPI0035C7AB0F
MSSVRTSGYRRLVTDHFEPQDESDPTAQRRLRGQLEQIDYTAFASNREVLAQAVGAADAGKFQRLALAAAQARAAWVAAALKASEHPHPLSPAELAQLAHLRQSFEELSEAYEAMRRMVERGYIAYRMATPS